MKNLALRLLMSVAALAGASLAAQPVLAAEATPSFDVLEFVIEGNTVLPPGLVEKLMQPYMGPGKTFKDIEAARAALEKAYQDAGFLSVVVSLPNQRVDQGEVRLEVTEAKVSKLKVTGAQYNLPSKVADQVPSLAQGKVPYFPQVQDELGALQRPDMQVTPLIAAGDKPEDIQVELKVEDKPAVNGSIELNSRQSFNTRRGRVEALASYGNLFQRGHSLGLSWQYAPWRPSDANTLTVVYGFPVAVDDSVMLAMTNSASDTPTGTSLGGATLTRGQFFSSRWRHQFAALNWPVNHSLSWGLDYKNNKDRSQTGSGLTTAKPPLRYPVLNVSYDLGQQGSQSSTNVRTSVATTFRDMAHRQVNCEGVETDQFDCKRYGARADFLVWKFGLDHNQELGDGWRLSVRADAQLASGPLVGGEQYSLGGVDTVRGYYDYEQAGDRGWSMQWSVNTPNWLQAGDWRGSALVFVDRGAVTIEQALSGQIAHVNLGSYGLGLRVDAGKGLQMKLDVAMPVFETRRAADAGGFEYATRRKARWEFSAKQAF